MIIKHDIFPKFNKLRDDTSFECTLCGQCCQLPLLITETDNNLFYELINTVYIDKNSKRKVSIIKHNKFCQFLSCNKCTVYDKRPAVCRSYPFYLFKNEVYYDSNCPGIGKGNQASTKEVTKNIVDRTSGISDETFKKIIKDLFGSDDKELRLPTK